MITILVDTDVWVKKEKSKICLKLFSQITEFILLCIIKHCINTVRKNSFVEFDLSKITTFVCPIISHEPLDWFASKFEFLTVTWLLQSLRITPLEVSEFPSPPHPPAQRSYIKKNNAAFLKYFRANPFLNPAFICIKLNV